MRRQHTGFVYEADFACGSLSCYGTLYLFRRNTLVCVSRLRSAVILYVRGSGVREEQPWRAPGILHLVSSHGKKWGNYDQGQAGECCHDRGYRATRCRPVHVSLSKMKIPRPVIFSVWASIDIANIHLVMLVTVGVDHKRYEPFSMSLGLLLSQACASTGLGKRSLAYTLWKILQLSWDMPNF